MIVPIFTGGSMPVFESNWDSILQELGSFDFVYPIGSILTQKRDVKTASF